jgi:hypothetical protein
MQKQNMVFVPRKIQTEPSATDIQQEVEGKGSIVPVHAMKAYRGNAYKALTLAPDGVLSLRLQPLYTSKRKPAVPNEEKVGWVPRPV